MYQHQILRIFCFQNEHQLFLNDRVIYHNSNDLAKNNKFHCLMVWVNQQINHVFSYLSNSNCIGGKAFTTRLQ